MLKVSYRVRRTRWFYHTTTTLLAMGVGAFLGWEILMNPPKVPIAIVLGIFTIVIAILRPFHAFIGWVILGPLFQTSEILMGRGIPNLTFDRFVLGFLFVSVVLHKLIGRRARGRIDAVDIAIIAFIAISVVNLLVTRPPESMVLTLFRMRHAKELTSAFQAFIDHYLLAIGAFYIVRNLATDHRRINIILVAAALTVLYLVPIGVIEHLTGRSWFTLTSNLYWADANRAAGPFKNPAGYGCVLAIALLFAVHLFFQAKATSKRILYGLIIAAACVGEVVTYTRAAWLAPVVAVLGLLLLYEGKRRMIAAWLVVGVVVLIAAIPVIQQSRFYERRILSESPIRSRVYATRVSMEMFKAKPIFGHGISNFDYYRQAYHTYVPGISQEEKGASSHNTFLTMLVETGIVGFLPYAAFIAILTGQWVFTYRRAKGNAQVGGRQLAATLACATLSYFVTAVIIDMRYFKYVEYLFWMLLALINVQYCLLRQSGSEVAEENRSSPRSAYSTTGHSISRGSPGVVRNR
ncbi:MAG: O-antigen ligase family protein [Armatimonadetes bacterium]|nr:O-antigen ligase family protein [Armatimonadota bacterium]